MVLIPDFREITYQTPYQPKTGLLTVYQLFEVRGYLFLRVSTVSNKKKNLIFISSFSAIKTLTELLQVFTPGILFLPHLCM